MYIYMYVCIYMHYIIDMHYVYTYINCKESLVLRYFYVDQLIVSC